MIARILVGNSSTQYVSNFYSPKPFDMNELNKRFDEFKEEMFKRGILTEDEEKLIKSFPKNMHPMT